MGGRGASSGVSEKGKPYGSEYHTVFKDGNIKFVKANGGHASAPMETMTRGRVYVTVNDTDKLKFISYYDTENKRVKQIDLDRPHKGVLPHTHHGYEHFEMVDRVKRIWYNRHSKQ